MSRPVVPVRVFHVILSAVLSVVWLGVAGPVLAQPDHPMAAIGRIPGHGTLSTFPWEQIDAYTGNVRLSFTDLVLPGNAGFNLVVQRTFNSKEVNTTSGRGWTWGVGPRMLAPDGLPPSGMPGWYFPRIRMADGAEVRLHQTVPGVFLSPSFDRYTVATRTLQMANGITAHFDSSGDLTDMVDAFGNLVQVTVDAAHRIQQVTQVLSASQNRVVTFHYAADTGVLTSITCQDRTWQYLWEDGWLTQVIPPAGPVWTFAYDTQLASSPLRLMHAVTVTLPQGGQVQYVSWETRDPNWPSPNNVNALNWPYGILKLYQRHVSASGTLAAPDDTWTFNYTDNGATTTVTGTQAVGPEQQPYGASFNHYPGGTDMNWSEYYDPTQASPEALLVGSSGTGQDPMGVTWQASLDLGTPEQHWPDPPVTDPHSYFPSVVTRTRGGHSYTTSYFYGDSAENHQHFGQPVAIIEAGDFTRTTSYTYQSFTGATYLADRVSSEEVAVGTETHVSSYVHDGTTGFLTSQTRLGVETDFSPDGYGNVATTTDASGHVTSTSYAWGVGQTTVTPIYTIARGINPDGTLASETRQSQTVAYTYDTLGRVILLTPRVGAPTVTTYDNATGRSVQVTRGPSSTTQTLDGYGRLIRSVTATGVTADVAYDAWGRRTVESAPYQTPTYPRRDTTTQYDALDRVTRIDRPDGSWITYAYDGLDVVITESVVNANESTRTSSQYWVATGSPERARLVAVRDATRQWTTYQYSALGQLTKVCGPGVQDAAREATCTAPGAVQRTWVYNVKNQLAEETHPESGRTTYTYHLDQTLASKTDAALVETTYTYDANDRLTGVQTPGRSTTFEYDDWDNRTVADTGSVRSVFAYEAGARLTSRTDVIGGHQFVTSYAPYDTRDNLLTVVYPSGQMVGYEYDADNRITLVRDAWNQTTYAGGVTYHPAGGVKQFTAGNGVIHEVAYDDRARPQRVTAGPLDLTYTYDHLGNVGQLDDNHRGASWRQTFSYDPLDRLTLLAGAGAYPTQAFAYDALGNRSGAGQVIDAATQRLVSTTSGGVTTSYTYDANGSVRFESGGRTVTYTYTPERLVETATVGSPPTYTATYTYDSDGLRTRVVEGPSPATTRYFVHGLGTQLLSEYVDQNGTPQWQVAYVYLGSRLLAALRPGARLTVTKAGWGTGTVTSTPTGINCGGTCDRTFYQDTAVALSATPAAGSVFVGWSDSTCGQFTLSAARSCTATFQPVIGVPRMWVDMPTAGGQQQPMHIGGWAIDQAAPTGTGVAAAHVWAYPNPGSGTPPIFLGVAAYGGDRPDIAATFGSERFRYSGFDLMVTGLAPNTYQIVVSAYSTFYGGFNQSQSVVVQIPTTNPAMWIDTPANGAQVGATFTIAGWAIDRNAPWGVGVDVLHIYAYLNGGGMPTFVGVATTGPARPDIAAVFGSQFLNSSWGLTASGLSPGAYLLVVYPHDTITDGFTAPSAVWVTVGGAGSASPGPRGGTDARPTGPSRPRLPEREPWPSWLMATLAALVGLTLTGRRVLRGHGWSVGGLMRRQHALTVLIITCLLGMTGAHAQEVAPAAPPLQVVQALLALSYPELRVSGLVARAVTTPDGIVMEFAERGPAVADLVARTDPRPAQLTATVTLDGAGRLRHVVCRGLWTGLERSRAVLGTGSGDVEGQLRAAQARFGSGEGEAVKSEVQRLLDRHGLMRMGLDAAALQAADGTVLWVAHGATETGEAVAVHLEPLTGKLIAFHVGGDR